MRKLCDFVFYLGRYPTILFNNTLHQLSISQKYFDSLQFILQYCSVGRHLKVHRPCGCAPLVGNTSPQYQQKITSLELDYIHSCKHFSQERMPYQSSYVLYLEPSNKNKTSVVSCNINKLKISLVSAYTYCTNFNHYSIGTHLIVIFFSCI